MKSKIAAVIIGLTLAVLIVHHARSGEYGLVVGDLVAAGACFWLFWQPHRRRND